MTGKPKHQPEERADTTVWRDVMACLAFCFVVVAILLLPHVNPPQSGEALKDPPGNVIVEIRWPDGMATDVDLWVRAPGDEPVGYSNLNGRRFNLLRDDLGNYMDLMELNYENAYTRGIAPGEYIANVHLYRNNSGTLPVPVAMTVSVRQNNRPIMVIARETVELLFVGQEVTVIRWAMDEKGRPIHGTIHDVPFMLRSAPRHAVR